MISKEEQAALKAGRRNVIRAIFISATLSVLSIALILPNINIPSMPQVTDRLVFTLRWNTLSVVFIIILIHVIASTRLHSAQINPFSSSQVEKVAIHCRVLQNTLEQFIVHFTLQLVLATWLEAEGQMKWIPIVVVLFVVGRVLFWVGFMSPSLHHSNRAYGMSITMMTNIIMAVYCMYRLADSLTK